MIVCFPTLSELIGAGQEVQPPSNMSSAADLLKQGAGELLGPCTVALTPDQTNTGSH